MISLKTSRRSRLQEDEEDSLLAGVDFQSHYLGHQEVFLDGCDIDNVVQSIYSQYSTNEDINNSTVVAITVGPHQLEFFNVSKKEIEFYVETPYIKSIHCGGNRPKKFPNAVVLVTCVPESPSKVHVIHCKDQRKAKKIYDTISRAFEYNLPENSGLKNPDATKAVRSNKIQPNSNNIENKEKNESQTEPSLFRNGNKTSKVSFTEGNLTKSHSAPDVTRSKSRTKSSTQAKGKGVEGLGLLDNVDPEEGFDDEFTDFARSRSTPEPFKLFGR